MPGCWMIATAAETRVLDLPLGGKPKIAARCGDSTAAVKALCWVSRPTKLSTGHTIGSALAPTDGNRPAWAAFVLLELTVAKDGTLEKIEASGPPNSKMAEIAASIRSRFGLPTEVFNLPSESAHSSKWRGKEAAVDLFCVPESGCKVTFRTPESEAARQAELAERDRATKARPVGP